MVNLVMQERLRNHMKRQAVLAAAAAIAPSSDIILAGEQSGEGTKGNTDSTISNAGETRYASTVHATAFLLHFVTSEDISDVSEYEEVENNLQVLFRPLGSFVILTSSY